MRTIVIFEGMPGGGKTTLINKLNNELGISMVPEIIDQSERWKKARKKRDQNFFWNNDIEKLKTAKLGKGLILVDRAHPSTLAFNYAKWVLHKKSDFERLMQNYFAQIYSKNLKPDAYIFFSIPPKLVTARKGEKINNHPWRDYRYLEKINDFYKLFFNMFEPDVPFFFIDASQKQLVILKRVKNILNKIKNR